MDRFAGFVGKLIVEIDGEKEPLELSMELVEKHEIIRHLQRVRKNPEYDSETPISILLKKILVRSYPLENPAALDGFLFQKFDDVMFGLLIAFKLTTKEELEKNKKRALEKISETTETKSPQ
jgi:hypothetical protein